MRVNLYGEELTEETELVSKTVTEKKFGTRTFYGIRLYLHSPDVLHSDPEDDDRSAVTFWIPWSRENGHDFGTMYNIFAKLSNRAAEAYVEDRKK